MIEHNLDVVAAADCVIDLGPEGGDEGGRVVAWGPPETVARTRASRTAPYLAAFLRRRGVTRPRRLNHDSVMLGHLLSLLLAAALPATAGPAAETRREAVVVRAVENMYSIPSCCWTTAATTARRTTWRASRGIRTAGRP